ncbi:MAG: hypothetical protein FJX73_05490 [Armatimonadetes bacterium]|nr:hypothetical protein [Armatimonadota bacterium]
MNRLSCAYCGSSVSRADREHVVPRCLYPDSKRSSKVQRLTVPACRSCNTSWSDDEAHFRNMMLIAGEPNSSVQELWQTKTRRSFREVDGPRRMRDLLFQLKPVETADGLRHMVYPASDERVMRIIRKIVRGLCHHHCVVSPVQDQQVRARVLEYLAPPELLDEMSYHHLEKDVFEYRYAVLDEPEINSAWLLTFFERRKFIATVTPLQPLSEANGETGN